MFGNDRRKLRQVFHDAWIKHRRGAALEAMEQAIVGVIELHPEYHALLSDPDSLDRDWSIDHGETNPFLHMSMHLGLIEQIQTDRPAGIRALYQRLGVMLGDRHRADHQMMECLGASLWQAQRAGTAPDERDYLDCLQRLVADRR
jgi:hypothetical protein